MLLVFTCPFLAVFSFFESQDIAYRMWFDGKEWFYEQISTYNIDAPLAYLLIPVLSLVVNYMAKLRDNAVKERKFCVICGKPLLSRDKAYCMYCGSLVKVTKDSTIF